jgi:hypothetical protein
LKSHRVCEMAPVLNGIQSKFTKMVKEKKRYDYVAAM